MHDSKGPIRKPKGLVERSKARRSGPSPSHRSDWGDMPTLAHVLRQPITNQRRGSDRDRQPEIGIWVAGQVISGVPVEQAESSLLLPDNM